MTVILEKAADGATLLWMRSIGLGTITTTEETLGIHLLHGLGQGNAIKIVVEMTTLTATESHTETEETPGIAHEIATTETLSDPQQPVMIGKNTNKPPTHPLPESAIHKTLQKSNHLRDQEQIAIKTLIMESKTPTTQANQIIKSYFGV